MDDTGPDLLGAVWRFRWFVLVVTALVCAASAGVGLLLARGASATATVALTPPSATNVLVPGSQSDAALTRYTSSRALFVKSDDVLGNASRRLAGTTVAQLRTAVTATPATGSTSLTLQATGAGDAQAVLRVDSVVAAYREETARQVATRTGSALAAIEANAARLRATLAGNGSAGTAQSAATALAELTRQSNALQTDSASFDDGVDFVQAAGRAPAGSRLPLREAALGALLGLAVAGALAWLRADRDRRVSRPGQAEPLLGVPVLGELPRQKQSPTSLDSRGDLTRRCREILAPLLGSRTREVIMVTSAERAAGCTTTTYGFAAAAAAESLRVLAVDGDPTGRGLSAALGLPPDTPGLGEASQGDAADISSYYREVEVGSGLKIAALSAGALPTGDWTVTANGLRRLLERLRPMFDVVLIDAPTPGSEYVSSVLLGMVDSVVVVVRRQGRVSRLTELRERVRLVDGPLLGTVFTFAAPRRRQR